MIFSQTGAIWSHDFVSSQLFVFSSNPPGSDICIQSDVCFASLVKQTVNFLTSLIWTQRSDCHLSMIFSQTVALWSRDFVSSQLFIFSSNSVEPESFIEPELSHSAFFTQTSAFTTSLKWTEGSDCDLSMILGQTAVLLSHDFILSRLFLGSSNPPESDILTALIVLHSSVSFSASLVVRTSLWQHSSISCSGRLPHSITVHSMVPFSRSARLPPSSQFSPSAAPTTAHPSPTPLPARVSWSEVDSESLTISMSYSLGSTIVEIPIVLVVIIESITGIDDSATIMITESETLAVTRYQSFVMFQVSVPVYVTVRSHIMIDVGVLSVMPETAMVSNAMLISVVCGTAAGILVLVGIVIGILRIARRGIDDREPSETKIVPQVEGVIEVDSTDLDDGLGKVDESSSVSVYDMLVDEEIEDVETDDAPGVNLYV
jgi:hypothetical protein